MKPCSGPWIIDLCCQPTARQPQGVCVWALSHRARLVVNCFQIALGQLDSSAGLKYFCKDTERILTMSIRGKTAVVGIGETPTDRLGSKPGERENRRRNIWPGLRAWRWRMPGSTKKISTARDSRRSTRPIIHSRFGLRKSRRFSASRRAFHSPAATAAQARYRCLAMPRRRSLPGFAISCWLSPLQRRSANTAVTAARPRTRAITNALRCHGTELQNFLRHEPLHARIGHDRRALRQDRRHRPLSRVAESQRLSEKADHHRRLQKVAADFRPDPPVSTVSCRPTAARPTS